VIERSANVDAQLQAPDLTLASR